MRWLSKYFCFGLVLQFFGCGPGGNSSTLNVKNEDASPVQEKAIIGFGKVVSDTEITGLMDRYELIPLAAFYEGYGSGGTHRTSVNKSTSDFFRDKQEAQVAMLEKHLSEVNLPWLANFVERHTEEEFLSNESLQKEVRDMLNIRASKEADLEGKRRGEPDVYAIEVSGDTGNVERLRLDPMVVTFSIVGSKINFRGKGAILQQHKPEGIEKEYLDPVVSAMSANALAQHIIYLLETSIIEEDLLPPSARGKDRWWHFWDGPVGFFVKEI